MHGAGRKHFGGVLFAVAALALLAYALWEVRDDDCDDMPVRPMPVEPKGQPGSAHRRVATYDGGRTTIPPKISAAAVARIRARSGFPRSLATVGELGGV